MATAQGIQNGESAQRDDSSGLSSTRAEFAASLTRRLDAVLGALSALEQQPAAGGRRDNFLRRAHALGASAKVLGFAAAAEVLTRAEHLIRTSQTDTFADDILLARKQLQDLPSFVLRGAYSLAPPSAPAAATKPPPARLTEPLAIVVWGSKDLLDALKTLDNDTGSLELACVDDPTKLREACVAFGPDILLLDATQGSITLVVDEIAQAPELAETAIVVANVPDDAAPRLMELGARLVLPIHATSQQISRALVQVRHANVEQPPTPAPFGDMTLKELAERLSQEIRQGLVDTAAQNATLEPISLGHGTQIRAALWSALAQIREHLVDATHGKVTFAAGPEGAVPLAPRGGNSPRISSPSKLEAIDLTGRRILVVDDDPAVAWFVGGTLRAAGAAVTEVHDGSHAFDLACRLWPELVVSDVIMPGLDGFALCHALKRDVLLRDVPVVLLSWKEDLLFRLRDLGADADGYLRKEADASTIVRRVRELLHPRATLESRLANDQETRGRLDGNTTRLLLELTTSLDRPVRIALRDSYALYDIRLRHGTVAAVTRTLPDGTFQQGEPVLGPMLGITAGRFSVMTDRDPCDAMFTGSLQEVLGPTVLRARAAQRVLAGLTLGLVDHLELEPSAFGSEVSLLPLSLKPIADELVRGTSPRQLLASGVASVQLLESLLSDVARRGAVRSIVDSNGEDLLQREVQALASAPNVAPPRPATLPPPLFSFQLSPAPPEVAAAHAQTGPTPSPAPLSTESSAKPVVRNSSSPSGERKPIAWDLPSGTSSGLGRPQERATQGSLRTTQAFERDESLIAPTGHEHATSAQTGSSSTAIPLPLPVSKPPLADDVDWTMELNWDSTPPPRTQDLRDSQIPIPTRSSTSGGFMRPAIAALDRKTLNETPDLANAVVRAVSEVTPLPGWTAQATTTEPAAASHPGSSSTIETVTSTEVKPRPADCGADSISTAAGSKHDHAPRNDANPNKESPPDSSTTDLLSESTDSSADQRATADDIAPKIAEYTAATPKSNDLNTRTSTTAPVDIDGPIATVTPAIDAHAETTTKSSDVGDIGSLGDSATEGRTTIAAAILPHHVLQVLEPSQPPRKVAGPPLEPGQLPQSEGPANAAPSAATPAPNPVGLALQGARDGAVPEATLEASSPAALPVVNHPPRPKVDPVLGREPTRSLTSEREIDDPVFPLVSTANVSVEVQTSIDVGAAASPAPLEVRPKSDSATGDPNPIQNRDTLRSPEGADPQAQAIQQLASSPTPSRLDEDHVSPVTNPPPSSVRRQVSETRHSERTPPNSQQERSPSARPGSISHHSTAPGATAQLPRPVGWIQALGLAALAGIVTFAVTVPLASWIRRRHEPSNSEPLALVDSAPTPSSGDLAPAASSPADEGVIHPSGSATQATGSAVADLSPQGSASARVEELQTPADASLPPGQAIIEVVTGGGHAIFVDDAFVGRGPVRIVPVQSGRHVVRTRLNGTERSDPIEIGPGKSLRLSLEQAWK